jgi:predicted Fe-S protein YdhL (DUF1289 family)
MDKYFVSSPCIRECTLDDDDICVGCFRSRKEIIDWLGMDEPSQRATLKRCETRKAQRKKTLMEKLKQLAGKCGY